MSWPDEKLHAYIRQKVFYDPDTGVFFGRKHMRPRGVLTLEGYVRVPIGYEFFPAHRLAWLYVHGKWPDYTIDHINGIKCDNSLANLRDIPIEAHCHGIRSGIKCVNTARRQNEAFFQSIMARAALRSCDILTH